MDTDRIALIKYHLGEAGRIGGSQSEHNWAASKYIWEEVQAGTKQVDLAKEIGKSPAHVTRLKKCWKIFVIDPGVVYGSLVDLGSFYEAYNSPEVHGESSRHNERNRRTDKGQAPGGKNRRTQDQEFSGHGLVTQAFTALSILANHPAFWPLLGEEDWVMLKSMPDLAGKINPGP